MNSDKFLSFLMKKCPTLSLQVVLTRSLQSQCSGQSDCGLSLLSSIDWLVVPGGGSCSQHPSPVTSLTPSRRENGLAQRAGEDGPQPLLCWGRRGSLRGSRSSWRSTFRVQPPVPPGEAGRGEVGLGARVQTSPPVAPDVEPCPGVGRPSLQDLLP